MGLRIAIIVGVIAALGLAASPALTQVTSEDLDMEALKKQPGVEIEQTGEGPSKVTTVSKGGVIFQQSMINGQMRTLATDKSGHGAVLCTWEIYIELRETLAACHPEVSEKLIGELDEEIDQINDFIAKNSIKPTTKVDVEASLHEHQKFTQLRLAKLTTEQKVKMCSRETADGFMGRIMQTSRAQRLASLEKLLSAPRPPVINPCL